MLGPCDRVLDQINCIELLYVTAVQQRGFGSMPALAQECTARNEETPAGFPKGVFYQLDFERLVVRSLSDPYMSIPPVPPPAYEESKVE